MHDPNWQSVQENLDSTNFTNNLIFHHCPKNFGTLCRSPLAKISFLLSSHCSLQLQVLTQTWFVYEMFRRALDTEMFHNPKIDRDMDLHLVKGKKYIQFTTSSPRLDGGAYCGAPVGGKWMVSKAKLVLYAFAV